MASIFKKAKDRSSKDKMRTSSGNSLTTTPVQMNPLNPLNAPTEVAQATNFHTARNTKELSFKKGDFFHVISHAPAADGTIEIFDPVNNIKGRAPASCFKIFEKTHRPNDSEKRMSSNGSTPTIPSSSNGRISSSYENPQLRHASTTSTNSTSSYHPPQQQQQQQQHVQPHQRKDHVIGNLFGVVLYDFHAERSDELSVNAGDSIFICAHHEYEWYIAKFLNKVGEVGLVPVSYVQLIDAVTRIPYKESPRSIMERENLPTVDEWKAMKNRHKASTRSVGPQENTGSLSRKSSQQGYQRSGSISQSLMKRNLSESYLIPANTNIESFSSTNNKFWFLIRASMSDGSIRSLCRYYEDFFNFHQKILSTWPREGGKFDTKDKKERILPFIPGPVIDVTESLCHKRLIDLNEYLSTLLQLPDYISKSHLVLSFFDLMDGDEISSDSSKNIPVEPHRAAPNLKIINSDNSQAQQQPQQVQQRIPSETLSQSHYDRRSQYEIVNRSNSISNKVGEFTSTRKSSSASVMSQSLPSSQPPSLVHSQTTSSTAKSGISLKLKLKFYYKDDIFALIVQNDTKLSELKSLIVPKLDEAGPGIESRIEIYSKNTSNVDQSNYDRSQIMRNDNDLWNDPNFVDKGKFLVIV